MSGIHNLEQGIHNLDQKIARISTDLQSLYPSADQRLIEKVVQKICSTSSKTVYNKLVDLFSLVRELVPKCACRKGGRSCPFQDVTKLERFLQGLTWITASSQIILLAMHFPDPNSRQHLHIARLAGCLIKLDQNPSDLVRSSYQKLLQASDPACREFLRYAPLSLFRDPEFFHPLVVVNCYVFRWQTLVMLLDRATPDDDIDLKLVRPRVYSLISKLCVSYSFPRFVKSINRPELDTAWSGYCQRHLDRCRHIQNQLSGRVPPELVTIVVGYLQPNWERDTGVDVYERS